VTFYSQRRSSVTVLEKRAGSEWTPCAADSGRSSTASTLRPSRKPPGLADAGLGLYNELGIASLILMSLSGLYLWLSSRPKHRLAQISFALGTGSFAVLYWLSR
jgi:hypothetical protein